MKKEADILPHVQILLDVVKHPKKYTHVINVPGRYDAAYDLYHNHMDVLNAKDKTLVASIINP